MIPFPSFCLWLCFRLSYALSGSDIDSVMGCHRLCLWMLRGLPRTDVKGEKEKKRRGERKGKKIKGKKSERRGGGGKQKKSEGKKKRKEKERKRCPRLHRAGGRVVGSESEVNERAVGKVRGALPVGIQSHPILSGGLAIHSLSPSFALISGW